ncbi:MAG: hypothetical protein BWX47_01033 [candidate division Hyd24-12 bacterium ADurb.Bin004]|nr:MAG: hypothetical protein BWX47_01033 [candidate division Hyd24-12 bacterium ADurb.Bin004]
MSLLRLVPGSTPFIPQPSLQLKAPKPPPFAARTQASLQHVSVSKAPMWQAIEFQMAIVPVPDMLVSERMWVVVHMSPWAVYMCVVSPWLACIT